MYAILKVFKNVGDELEVRVQIPAHLTMHSAMN